MLFMAQQELCFLTTRVAFYGIGLQASVESI